MLLLYASTHGHTAKIAARIAEAVADEHLTVDLHDIESGAELNPADYRGVIVGASIHVGKHQSEIVDWCERHRTMLSLKPSAFFSVCLTAADDTEESHRATRAYLDTFVEQTGWTPEMTATFAGAIQYLEYDFATRLLVRLLMRHQHRPTDVSEDIDYTDWPAVDRFAAEWVATLGAPVAR